MANVFFGNFRLGDAVLQSAQPAGRQVDFSYSGRHRIVATLCHHAF